MSTEFHPQFMDANICQTLGSVGKEAGLSSLIECELSKDK